MNSNNSQQQQQQKTIFLNKQPPKTSKPIFGTLANQQQPQQQKTYDSILQPPGYSITSTEPDQAGNLKFQGQHYTNNNNAYQSNKQELQSNRVFFERRLESVPSTGNLRSPSYDKENTPFPTQNLRITPKSSGQKMVILRECSIDRNNCPNKNLQEIIKSEVQEQLEFLRKDLVQAYEKVIQECQEKSNLTSEVMSSLKETLYKHSSNIQSINQQVEDLSVRIHEANCSSGPMMTGGEDDEQKRMKESEEMCKRVEQAMKGVYEQKIMNVENSQQEIREVLMNVKEELIQEISQQMSLISSGIQEKALQEDEKIYNYVREMRNNWEERLNMIFEQMSNKIGVIEKNINSVKKEYSEPKLDKLQLELTAQFEEGIKKYEAQLLQIKALIDSKLDKADLQDVLEGYRNLKDDDQLIVLSREIKQVKDQISSGQGNLEKVNVEFNNKIKTFDALIQTTLGELEKRVNQKQEKEAGLNQKAEYDMNQKINELEATLEGIAKQYSNLDQELKAYDQNAHELRIMSEKRFKEITNDLKATEEKLAAKDLNTSNAMRQEKGNLDKKVTDLEASVQTLMERMNQIQGTLDKDFEDFNDKFEIQKNLQRKNFQVLEKDHESKVLASSCQTQQSIEQQQQQRSYQRNGGGSVQCEGNSNSQQGKNVENTNVTTPQKSSGESYYTCRGVEEAADEKRELPILRDSQIDVKASNISSKFDEYIKKYEEFNKEVNQYLCNRKGGATSGASVGTRQSLEKLDRKQVFNHPQIGLVNLGELVSPQRDLNLQQITTSPVVSLYSSPTLERGSMDKFALVTQSQQQISSSNEYGKLQIITGGTNGMKLDFRRESLEQVQKQLRMSEENIMDQQSNAMNCNQMKRDEQVEGNSNDQVLMDPQQQTAEQMKSEYKMHLSSISEKEGEEDEIVYQLDDQGYLLDEQGQYIVDDQGKRIQLSVEHIEYLKSVNMLEENQEDRLNSGIKRTNFINNNVN